MQFTGDDIDALATRFDKKLQRDINCLEDDDRSTRKRAIEKISSETVGRRDQLNQDELQDLFKAIIKPLLKRFSDPVEKCRQLSIKLTSSFLSKVKNYGDILPYLIPCVRSRLATPEIVEPSEEIRLQLMKLLLNLCNWCSSNDLAVYLDDYVAIIQRCIVDPFPDAKKESCNCIIAYANLIPSEKFQLQSESLIKPLTVSLAHQHSKVRIVCLKAIGVTLQKGSISPLNDILPSLAQRMLDHSPSVRSTLTEILANWMMNLMDRYSYFHKILPLLLTSQTDELPEIVELGKKLYDKVGEQYEKENEEELKDQLDYENPTLSSASRPRLGCRVLVQRNFSKILPALLRDAADWTVISRIKSTALLHVLLIHAEDHVTQHIGSLLPGLYKACQDDEKVVADQSESCATVVGKHVHPDIFVKLVLNAIKSASGGGGATATASSLGSCLRVFAAMLKECDTEKLSSHLQTICSTLCHRDICMTELLPCQIQLLHIVKAIITNAGINCKPYCKDLFKILIYILALQSNEGLHNQIEETLSELASCYETNDRLHLYKLFMRDLLTELKGDHGIWVSSSPERYVFECLLRSSGPVVGQMLDIAIPILISNLNPEKDPELRLKFFTLFSNLLVNANMTLNSEGTFIMYIEGVIADAIISNCVWKAGRAAAAMRTAAMSCLWALLQSGLATYEQLSDLLDEILTKVKSCIDDDNQSTRLISCKVLHKLLQICETKLDADALHNLYPDLLKRLDDNNNEIRVVVGKTWITYFRYCDELINYLQGLMNDDS
ncbi:uncharacterized protein TRIADDRAFT_53253 [Trichoplax adhaerens]|uniref:TOG domain-containing protein n=1 Tax=Trichoplax adhaerens TaxID=10228 RepID=B3RNQ8_TRIAD|nr:hypothetical protein TRIADDRAFT_53253 [Trichoplax adhaerens]EDV28055.1 hypothetical protein TRIADDRAFT_53253 [Trichoplax adhaerens]|eukprot:XP_002109889.1 hypothetical protein TRIADDRAFT_53253 [Trichoplax adhaerens]